MKKNILSLFFIFYHLMGSCNVQGSKIPPHSFFFNGVFKVIGRPTPAPGFDTVREMFERINREILISLSFTNCPLKENEFDDLIRILKVQKELREFEYTNSRLGDPHIDQLLEIFKEDPHLQTLNFGTNKIQKAFQDPFIIKYLREIPNLKRMDLRNNNIESRELLDQLKRSQPGLKILLKGNPVSHSNESDERD